MQLEAIAERLGALEGPSPAPAARFDADEPLRGPHVVLPTAFNPPTRAHFRLLEVAKHTASSGGAAALLSTRNVDKGIYGAPLEHRVGMLLAHCRSRSPLAVLATSAARISDQGERLREAYPEAAFDFVVGYDTLVRLFERRYYQGDMLPTLDRFFEHHRLIATNREPVGVEDVAAFLAREPARTFRERILLAEIDRHAASISSTAAREALESGEDPDELPHPVREYVRAHGLYTAAADTRPA